VQEIDGRIIGEGKRGTMCKHLQDVYMQLVETESRAGARV